MGNRYSLIREEEEEAEFQRLVEAVELAQRRSAGHGDLEAGLYQPPAPVSRTENIYPRPDIAPEKDGCSTASRHGLNKPNSFWILASPGHSGVDCFSPSHPTPKYRENDIKSGLRSMGTATAIVVFARGQQ
ncbi:hypothetical protein DICSQDRAFT_124975 [Dichomitus squalens LYAD-421 SS1]|uniref:uncharacterized protein n=1 Tax=Dichomitus squalens (strain LYAD-421) TaxID=732165 RepID=UPI00044136F9|nr:uncharacterized protein DICSQDRAFT_124975 [Dichomitus squalens LYAD-421 SS1]EJF64826.1 hypothetical protein DICSQDRAFT_124975 [Dichomitus squalens LYAD-421 SS1]